VEVSTGRNGYTEVVVLKPGSVNMCALAAVHNLMHYARAKNRFHIVYARDAAAIVDRYYYLRQPVGELFEVYGKEIDRHYVGEDHIVYDVPDDFIDIMLHVDSMCEQRPERRKEIRKLLKSKDRPPWEGFKDRLLAMEAAETL